MAVIGIIFGLVAIFTIFAFIAGIFNIAEEEVTTENDKRNKYIAEYDQETRSKLDAYKEEHLGVSDKVALRKIMTNADAAESLKRAHANHQYLNEKNAEWNRPKVVNRVFAYDYEEFILGLFSQQAQYDHAKNRWVLYGSELVDKATFDDALRTFCAGKSKHDFSIVLYDLIKHDVIQEVGESSYRLGATLSSDALIINEYDMDIDKWKKKHPDEGDEEKMIDPAILYLRREQEEFMKKYGTK